MIANLMEKIAQLPADWLVDAVIGLGISLGAAFGFIAGLATRRRP